MKNNLKAIRKKLGLTQGQLADMIGCTTSNVSHYERVGQRIRQEMAMRIVSVAKSLGLEITLEDIYGEQRMEHIQIAREEKPNFQILSDAFGSRHIALNGRIFITINYVAPWIDNAGIRSLSERILEIVKGEESPNCAKVSA